jgi:glycosyltransferase involved in cell wall biosynthesis
VTQSFHMKSIVHAADYGPSYSGNFIASLKALAVKCNSHGYRMVWVFPDVVKEFTWFKELSQLRDSSSYTLSRDASCFANAKALADIAAQENTTIIHTHFSFFDLSARMAQILLATKFHRIRLVWHVHSAFTDTSRLRRIKDFLKIGVFGRSCEFMPVSSPLGDAVAERGCPRMRIHVVENGIDVAHATAQRASRESIRAAWGVPDSTLALLGFGWTPIRKGVDTMLEALAALRRDGMEIALIISGSEELKRFVDNWPDQDIRSSVRLIPSAERVAELYSAADIFLSPSRAEGWCYSLAEAMLNRVPVIAAGIPDLIYAEHWPGLYFCEVGNGNSLAKCIRHVAALSKVELSARTAQAAEFISRRHCAESWAQEVWSLYQQILGDMRPRTVAGLSGNNRSGHSRQLPNE